jgi:hypothetical protein
MPIQAKSADGLIHQFPDGTDGAVIDRVMKQYATQQTPQEQPSEALLPEHLSASDVTRAPPPGSMPLLGPEAGNDVINFAKHAGRFASGIGNSMLETAKIPGYVAQGRISPEQIPQAGRELAGLIGGGEVAPLTAARAAVEGAQGIGEAGAAAARGVAKPIAAAASTAAATPGRLLPGATARAVDRLSQIGLPEGQAELGTKISDALRANVGKLRSTRAAQAESNKGAYVANRESTTPALQDYRSWVGEQLKDPEKNLSKEERKLLLETQSRTKGPISFEALDKERRRLNGIAHAEPEWKGHPAIKSKAASDAGEKLGSIMSQHNEAFGKYLEGYKSASEPLNQFKSLVGRSGKPEAAHTLPSRIFSSGKNYSTFRDLSPDPGFAEATARVYAASGLERATAGKSVGAAATNARLWLRKNEDWLKEEPALDRQARAYVDNLHATAKTRHLAYAASGVAAAALLASEGPRAVYWIRRLLAIP